MIRSRLRFYIAVFMFEGRSERFETSLVAAYLGF